MGDESYVGSTASRTAGLFSSPPRNETQEVPTDVRKSKQNPSPLDQDITDSVQAFTNATAWALSTMLNEVISLQKLLQQKRFEREVESRVWRSELPMETHNAHDGMNEESAFSKLRGATWGILEKVGLPTAQGAAVQSPSDQSKHELESFASGLAEIGAKLRKEKESEKQVDSDIPAANGMSRSRSDSGEPSSGSEIMGSRDRGPETTNHISGGVGIGAKLQMGPITNASFEQPSQPSMRKPYQWTLPPEHLDLEELTPGPTVGQQQALLRENESLHSQFQAEIAELDNIQSAITEIASLQTNLSVQIAEQAEKVEFLHQDAEQQTRHVDEGNQLLKKARKTLNAAYKYVAYIFVGLALVLAFLDWIG